VAEIMTKVEAPGETIVKPPQELSWGADGGYFADQDGYISEEADH